MKQYHIIPGQDFSLRIFLYGYLPDAALQPVDATSIHNLRVQLYNDYGEKASITIISIEEHTITISIDGHSVARGRYNIEVSGEQNERKLRALQQALFVIDESGMQSPISSEIITSDGDFYMAFQFVQPKVDSLIKSEADAREAADALLQQNIGNETSRAQGAEQELAYQIKDLASAAIGGLGTLYGRLDNTTGYMGAMISPSYLQKGHSVTYELYNFSGKENWHNWLAVVNNYGTTVSNPLVVLRNDNFEVVAYSSVNITSNFNWDTFKEDMNGALVRITFSFIDSTVKIRADITTARGETYFEEYTKDMGSRTYTYVFLSIDNSHLYLRKTTTGTV